ILPRLEELRILEEHKTVILDQLEKQGVLTSELTERLLQGHDLETVENLCLPFRAKRSAKAAAAIEQGLAPLAEALESRSLGEGKTPLDAAEAHVDPEKGVADERAALDGARALLIDKITVAPMLRDLLGHARIRTSPANPSRTLPRELKHCSNYEKPARSIPWQTFLRIKKGAREGHLEIQFGLPEEKAHQILAAAYAADLTDPADPLRSFYDSLLREAWHDRLKEPCEREVFKEIKTRADREAIRTYCKAYRRLLLSPSGGAVRVCGVLPAIRKPTRFVVVDESGSLVSHQSLNPLRIERREDAARRVRELVAEHGLRIIALGGGPGCREVEAFLMEALQAAPERPQILIVDEAGTMHLARREISRHDLSTRKAAILARRMQNGLAEWARLEPDQAPLGPFQDEVHQGSLRRSLEMVRESCLHAVGLDLMTAPEESLVHICGLDRGSTGKIIAKRRREGGIPSLQSLVDGNVLTQEALDLAAPFLRLQGSSECLDNTRIEPKHYGLVEEMAASLGLSKTQLRENLSHLDRLNLDTFVREGVSQELLERIVREIKRPFADPRQGFHYITFKPDLRTLEDLEMGMELQGRIMRIADFGAFVDVGVTTGGLLHVSQMSERYVGDPSRMLHEGQIVKVRVLEVDRAAGRLSLTMLSGDIKKVQRTLRDFAQGRKRPGAVVVRPSKRVEGESSTRARAAMRPAGARRDGTGPGRGRPPAREGGRREGGRGDSGRREGGRGKPYTVESKDIKKTEVEARGVKGELKSFAALASMMRPPAEEKPAAEGPVSGGPLAGEPVAEEPPAEGPAPEKPASEGPDDASNRAAEELEAPVKSEAAGGVSDSPEGVPENAPENAPEDAVPETAPIPPPDPAPERKPEARDEGEPDNSFGRNFV
ncbi:MAG: S1 RNA-binding domain-containing protein, partial [Planctomycetota bacterium]